MVWIVQIKSKRLQFETVVIKTKEGNISGMWKMALPSTCISCETVAFLEAELWV
uniref:Uncharacterized protein n=1 Tax=Rhizophora mucronata TaxID=61149 RepID=A0A2P2IS02_RHIMU